MTTVYGTEISFNTPKATGYSEFLDAFDAAIEALNSESGFYSVDAHINKENGAVLVGVNVPDGVEPQAFFASKMDALVLPALANAGIEMPTVSFAASKEFVYA